MKSFFLVVFLCLLSSCFSRTSMMTRETFDDIAIGTFINEVEEKVGSPYDVHSIEGGKEEYEYIERIDMGNQLISENHYFLIVLNGQVIGKRMSTEKPPNYNLMYQEDPNHYKYP
jgi:hypothetical protein